MSERLDVVVGTPIHRKSAYILDRFLANQREIQRKYPYSELVFATNEEDFATELKKRLDTLGIRGKALRYQTIKPDYAKSRVWNVVCGREAVRKYMLSQTDADYILWLDADMLYDSNIIEILKREIQGYDVVFSGYRLRESIAIALAGGGCCMVTRDLMEEIEYRCLEFRNGFAFNEDTLFEFDIIKMGKRMRKGFFSTIEHFEDREHSVSIGPCEVSLYRRILHSRYFRYLLIKTTMTLRYDIGELLNDFIYILIKLVRLQKPVKRPR